MDTFQRKNNPNFIFLPNMKFVLKIFFTLFIIQAFFVLVNPNTITAASEVCPENRDPAEIYNSYPICFEPDRFENPLAAPGENATLSPSGKLIGCLVKEQGYEVHYAAEPWNIWQDLINPDVAKDFFEDYPEHDTVIFDSCGAYALSASGSTVPIYRSEECPELTTKASSYEAFFGSLVPDEYPEFWGENVNPKDPTAAGVANHLLTKSQQCEIKRHNLETVDFYCGRLANLSTDWCYLNTPIKDSDYNTWSLWGELHSLISGYTSDEYGIGLSCDDITGTWQSLQKNKPWAIRDNDLTEEKFHNIQTALDNVTFNFENLYRTVFLFISVGQDPIDTHTESSLEGDYKPNLDSNEHMTYMFIFKVPDFLANESRFKDAATATKEVMLTDKQRSTLYTEAWDKRDDLFKAAIRNNIGGRFSPGDPIYCPNMPECQTSETSFETIEKTEPLTGQPRPVYVTSDTYLIIRNAVIDIINGHHAINGGYPEEGIVYEEAGEIGTSAHLENVERAQFIGEPITSYHPDGFKTTYVDRDFDWKFQTSNFDEYSENLEFENQEGLPVKAWIVAPYGIEQEHVFQAIQQGFFTLEKQKQLEAENIVVDSNTVGEYPRYFTFDDATYGVFFPGNCSGQKIFKFTDTKDESEECQVGIQRCSGPIGLPTTYCWWEKICPEKEFGKGIKEQKNRLNIFGALVGWGIGKIQESLHESGTFMHDYFSSCDRFEDLLSGKCGTAQSLSSNQEGLEISSNENWEPVFDENGNAISLDLNLDNEKCSGTLIKFAE